jgi:hypothetical protein
MRRAKVELPMIEIPAVRARRWAAILVVTGALAPALAGCSTSTGFETDDGLANLPPDQAAFSRIMQGLGAIDTRVEPIEYKPRQGLVVPPAQAKADLPTPVASVDPAQSGNWVRDPDQLERERRQAIEAARKNVDGRPLTTDEILAVNRAATGLDNPRANDVRDDGKAHVDINLMQNSRVNTQAALVDANGNPTIAARRRLTDPPATYLAPSPNAPVQTPQEKSGGFNWWPF